MSSIYIYTIRSIIFYFIYVKPKNSTEPVNKYASCIYIIPNIIFESCSKSGREFEYHGEKHNEGTKNERFNNDFHSNLKYDQSISEQHIVSKQEYDDYY